jgi:hypothetical protein
VRVDSWDSSGGEGDGEGEGSSEQRDSRRAGETISMEGSWVSMSMWVVL